MIDEDWVPAFEPVEFTHAGHTFRVEAAAHRLTAGGRVAFSANDDIVVSIDGLAPMETGLVAPHGMTRETIVALVLMWYVQRRRSNPSSSSV